MADSKGSAALTPSVVTLVEGNAMRSASGRARLVFLSVTAAGGVVGAIALSPWFGPWWGLVLGGAAGFALGVVLGVVVAVWPVLRVLVHWVAEISIVLGLVAGSTELADVMSPIVPGLVLLGITATAVLVPPLRRRLWALVWCSIVRHRLRLSFAAFLRSRNRIHVHGTHPLILLARPTPAGERVWVWLRPGLDLAALEESTTKLAVACWASSVRVTAASARYAALVRVDIARRDPLTGLVTPPVVDLIPTDRPALAAPGEPPTGGLDLDQVSDEAVASVVTLPRQRGGVR